MRATVDFQFDIAPADSIKAVKKRSGDFSVCRRFAGDSQGSKASDRAKTLRFIGVIVDQYARYRK
jgi:hypothetical protein